ncbi:hypothetical protein ACFYOD_32575 [Streptomyces sp. NPDC006703]|uniref:hypothetical protein n=1 Tax=Streptomyces sp. NPDC006703 TaxID=3364759 RepID=UPI00368DF378
MLGALKVATADQIQRIGAPHLSFRHTNKAPPSEQKTARTASHTGALSDLRKHGLSENGGSTETGERLRNLTLRGLEAASYELRRPAGEMGLHRTRRGLLRSLPPDGRQRDRHRDAAPEAEHGQAR